MKTIVADAREVLSGPSELSGRETGATPRFELFSASNSICSQKVRCVLAQHDMPYMSNSVNLFLGESYLPEYVRLRMIGCDELGRGLATRHSGSSSASTGCDPAVVPTLIDWDVGEVLVDSKRICIYLDDLTAETQKLRPESLACRIDDELSVVDHLPNYQMLMGRDASCEIGETKDGIGSSFSQRKITWCDDYLRNYADDPTLVRAYSAKRAKEITAVNDLFSSAAMQAAYSRAELALIEFEGKLKQSSGTWLLGEMLTMADLFWGIEVLRMQNMGADTLWKDGRLPEVGRFVAMAAALPSIQTSVINWPGAAY